MIVRYRGYEPELKCDEYRVSFLGPVFEPGHLPAFDRDNDRKRISKVGDPDMFGVRKQEERKWDKDYTTTLRLLEFLHQFPSVPIFPGTASPKRGDRWETKVPPVPFSQEQLFAPLKEHSVLEQHWTDTVAIGPYKCAKITYQLEDTGRGVYDEALATGTVNLDGVVYFALEEGIPVLEKCTVDVSFRGISGHKVESRTYRKFLLLIDYEPLADQDSPPLPDPHYEYQPPQAISKPPEAQRESEKGVQQPVIIPPAEAKIRDPEAAMQ